MKPSLVQDSVSLGAALLLGGCGVSSPNLVARGMDVTWAGTTHQVKAYVYNLSSEPAGPFFVYFDADEDPMSPQDRPQQRLHVDGLAPEASIELDADFSPLATAYNAQLANVKGITLRVDPKLNVAESNEQDNTLVTQLPGFADASAIFAPALRPNGYFEAWSGANPLSQTFTPPADFDVVGLELSILGCVPSTSEVLTVTVRQGLSVLMTSQLPMSSFAVDCSSIPPAISGVSFGTAFLDSHEAPVHLTAGTEYTIDLANPTNHVLHVGVTSDSVNGTVNENGNSHQFLDVSFKLYSGS